MTGSFSIGHFPALRVWLWLVLLPLCLLSACASRIDAKVTSFSAWPPDAAGSRFAFLRPTGTEGDLEQETYESYATAQLQSLGLVPVAQGQTPRILVELKTNFSTRDKVTSEPIYVDQSYFVPGTRDAHGKFIPGYWVRPFGSGYVGERQVTRTINTSRLKLRLLDTQGAPVGRPKAVFESTAVYAGDNPDLPDLVPYLVQAALDGFPGKNGLVRILRFDTETGQQIKR
ncbi:MAG: DUF4136 domain-containing protein [Burkholderiaceae bacterium]